MSRITTDGTGAAAHPREYTVVVSVRSLATVLLVLVLTLVGVMMIDRASIVFALLGAAATVAVIAAPAVAFLDRRLPRGLAILLVTLSGSKTLAGRSRTSYCRPHGRRGVSSRRRGPSSARPVLRPAAERGSHLRAQLAHRQKKGGNMRNTTKATAVGAGLGMVALAVLTPSLASGNARTDIGTGAAAAAVARPFVATLIGGAEEVPTPGDPDGAGQAAVTIDRASGEVCWDLRVSNVSTVTMAHIHRGVRGQAGPVVVDFSSALPNPTSAGCTTVAPALATEIATNPSGFYVNVHTTEFGGGAVRGQLAVSTSTSGQTRLLASPLRAYDSRVGTVGKMRVGETRTIDLATGVDSAGAITLAVPPGATGAVVRIAVDDTVSAGFLKAYSAALTAAPPTAVLNWYEARAIVGAESIVAVNMLGQIKITMGGVEQIVNGATSVPNQTHVIVDVVGFVY